MSLAHDLVGEDNNPVKAGLVRGKQLGLYKRGRKSEERRGFFWMKNQRKTQQQGRKKNIGEKQRDHRE